LENNVSLWYETISNINIEVSIEMTTEFIAMESVVIQDNFYSNPDQVRQQALTKTYEVPPDRSPRIAVTARCNEAESKAMFDLLAPHIPVENGNNLVGVDVLFRYSLAKAQKKIFCHVDGCSSAGIVYLTLPEDCAGGTSIFKHKLTGDQIFNKANAHLYNFFDASQWETLAEIDMVYNRLVFYPGQLFHSITPIFFGDRIENSRLTQNVFAYRQNDSTLMPR